VQSPAQVPRKRKSKKKQRKSQNNNNSDTHADKKFREISWHNDYKTK